MSSQGAKSSSTDKSVFSGDASNWTTMKKQNLLYSTLNGNVSKLAINLRQSSELRLDYNFGRQNCPGCTGAAFPDLTVGS